MTHRDEIIDFVDALLGTSDFPDYCPNGLQVEGAAEVTHVVSGVSASAALFEAAADKGAQMVICHHGLFWGNTPQAITGPMRTRLASLFATNMSLAAWHLPLDAHETLGNNALLADAIGLTRTGMWGTAKGTPIGYVGTYDEPLQLDELLARVREATDRQPLYLGPIPDGITRVAVCAGGSGGMVDQGSATGAQVMVSGEADEPTMALAFEYGIGYVAGGHWATETFGIRALGDRLAEEFGIEHTFVPVVNPV
jgi:dinuclear metal center YbgI/SA1388 family protein